MPSCPALWLEFSPGPPVTSRAAARNLVSPSHHLLRGSKPVGGWKRCEGETSSSREIGGESVECFVFQVSFLSFPVRNSGLILVKVTFTDNCKSYLIPVFLHSFISYRSLCFLRLEAILTA